MTMPRRSFLQLFGSSVGILAAGASAPRRAQRALETNGVASRKILVAHRGASCLRAGTHA